MNFIAQKADLLRNLALTQRIVEKRNTIPILANILIEAEKGSLNLTATDLEVGIRNACAGEVAEAGAATVSAKKLFEVIRALPEGEVRFRSTAEFGLEVTCARAEFRLVGLDSRDYPNLPQCDFENAWELPAGLFQKLLGKVLFAVTTDESRFPISGLLFQASQTSISLVATDGHRLAVAEAKGKLKGISGDIRLVMPKKALVELRQISELGEVPIACEVKDNHIYYRIGDRLLVARMVEDQFPAYDKVIPRSNTVVVRLAKADLEGAVRRASVLSNEKAKTVRFHFAENQLTLSASNPELGEAREDLPIEYADAPIEIAFNAQYLLDFLAVLDTDQVRAELKDGATQAILRPERAPGSEEEDEFQHYYVLMPMRL